MKYLKPFVSAAFTLSSVVCCFAQGTSQVVPAGGGFNLIYTNGSSGVTYQWQMPASGSSNSLGELVITATTNGVKETPITLSPSIAPDTGRLSLTSAALQASNGTALLTYQDDLTIFHVIVRPFMDGNIASLAVTADTPHIAATDIGPWPSSLDAKSYQVPYYSGSILYLPSVNLFANSYQDWTTTGPSVLNGTRSVYGTNTAGARHLLADTLKVVVGPQVTDVFPRIDNAASPYIQNVAGRMVLDIRSGDFATTAAELSTLALYGVDNCTVIVHDWQDQGYDNAYPDQYPANSGLGGNSSLAEVSQAARGMGCLFALHENYADYYPDYDDFTSSAVSRLSSDTEMQGWLNTSTNTQAFATKPSWFLKNAQTQSPTIHQAFSTNASFIDVNSSAEPWWRADMDASVSGNGTFGAYRDAAVGLWSYERKTHGGPVFGEGKYHWFWSGDLDGVEAQFGAEPTPITDGTKAPLFVDFDLSRIHPLQVNHGMGMYDRWMPDSQTISTVTQLDAYRMQEVIFGHAPYLSDSLWDNVPFAIREQNLVSPVAQSYAGQTLASTVYEADGAWMNASSALRTGGYTRVQATYANGLVVAANQDSNVMTWNGLSLPTSGWAAKGSDLLAYTAYRSGSIADYAQTAESLFADARNENDYLSFASHGLASPQVKQISFDANRSIAVQLLWNVYQPIGNTTYKDFVQLISPSGSTIEASTGGSPQTPSPDWQIGQQIPGALETLYLPANLPNGNYTLRVGLVSTSTEQRAVLWGNNDGSLRYTVGTVNVNGSRLTFTASNIDTTATDPRMNNYSNTIDFGTIRTNGMVSMQRNSSSGVWTMRVFPYYRDVYVDIAASALAAPRSLSCSNGAVLTPVLNSGGSFWQVDLRGQNSCHWTGAAIPSSAVSTGL
jgi:hypothetical protein